MTSRAGRICFLPLLISLTASSPLPTGVEIMATYTMGSEARAHERDVLACPGLRWLGVHSSDIEYYQAMQSWLWVPPMLAPYCPPLITSLAHSLARVRQVPKSLKIEMTDRDRSRVRKMLEREAFSTPARAFWKQQLQELLTRDCKYEIESLNAVNRSGSDPLGCVWVVGYSV